jgi:hypothetical protein
MNLVGPLVWNSIPTDHKESLALTDPKGEGSASPDPLRARPASPDPLGVGQAAFDPREKAPPHLTLGERGPSRPTP